MKFFKYLLCFTLMFSTMNIFAAKRINKAAHNTQKRVIIVGAGAAGIFTAYELNKKYPGQYDITIYEAKPTIGGHASVVNVNYDGKRYSLDTGPQFFSAKAQPDYMQLIDEVGLRNDIVNYPSGVNIWDAATNKHLFWIPSTLSGLKKYTLNDWENITEFAVFILDAAKLNYQKMPNWTLSLGDWLNSLKLLSTNFKNNIIKNFLYQFELPLSAYNNIDHGSAVFAVTYFLENVFGGPINSTQKQHSIPIFETSQSLIGISGILEKILKTSGATIHTNSPVTAITPDSRGVTVTINEIQNVHADAVVLATQPPAAAKILQNSTFDPALVTLLNNIASQYTHLAVAVQNGASCWLPSNIDHTEVANTIVDPIHKSVGFSTWFGLLRPPYGNGHLIPAYKSWNTPNLFPSNCHYSVPQKGFYYSVLIPTTNFIKYRDQIVNYQGKNHVYIAGGWTTWFDSQEAALLSALNTVNLLHGNQNKQFKRPLMNASTKINNIADWVAMIAERAPQPYRNRLLLISTKLKKQAMQLAKP